MRLRATAVFTLVGGAMMIMAMLAPATPAPRQSTPTTAGDKHASVRRNKVPIQPVPRFVYATAGDSTIACYSIDTATGHLHAMRYQMPWNAAGPAAVITTFSSKFLYTADLASNTISGYAVGIDGVLTPVPGSPFSAGAQPAAIAVDPSDSFIYAANYASQNVSAFTIDNVSGSLNPIPGSPFPAGKHPKSLIVDPSGQFVYVANTGDEKSESTSQAPLRWELDRKQAPSGQDTVSAFTIDLDGALAPVSGSPFNVGSHPSSLAAALNGQYLYVANGGSADISAFAINTGTGALRPVLGSPFKAGQVPRKLAVDNTGQFLYVTDNLDGINGYQVNQVTGALIPLPGSPYAAGKAPEAVIVDQSNRLLYVTNLWDDTVSVFARNLGSGAITPLSTMLTHNFPGAIAVTSGTKAVTFGPSNAYVGTFGDLYTPGNLTAFSIDATTGKLSPTGGSPYASGPFSELVSAGTSSSRFVYLPYGGRTIGSARVVGWSRNAMTGGLSPLPGSPFDVGFDAWKVALETSGRFGFAADYYSNTLQAYSIMPVTGQLKQLPGFPLGLPNHPIPESLTVDSVGKFLYFVVGGAYTPGQLHVYSINALSGSLSHAFSVGTGVYPEGIAVHPSGLFVYASNLSTSPAIRGYKVGSVNGSLTEVPGSPYANVSSPISLVVEPSGRFLYATALSSNVVSAYAINQTTGALTQITGSPFPTGQSPFDLAADVSGRYLYVADFNAGDVTAFTIDSHTGGLTAVPGSPFSAPHARSVVVVSTIQ